MALRNSASTSISLHFHPGLSWETSLPPFPWLFQHLEPVEPPWSTGRAPRLVLGLCHPPRSASQDTQQARTRSPSEHPSSLPLHLHEAMGTRRGSAVLPASPPRDCWGRMPRQAAGAVRRAAVLAAACLCVLDLRWHPRNCRAFPSGHGRGLSRQYVLPGGVWDSGMPSALKFGAAAISSPGGLGPGAPMGRDQRRMASPPTQHGGGQKGRRLWWQPSLPPPLPDNELLGHRWP